MHPTSSIRQSFAQRAMRPFTRPTPGLLAALIVLAVFAVFANTLRHQFVWDDEQFVVKNQFVTSPRHLPRLLTSNMVAGAGLTSNLYRPVQSLTHMLDVRLWGLHPAGHHATNLLLQVIVALLLFSVLRQFARPPAAALATLFFALHPLQTEAVAYVSGRGDLLAMACLFAGLLTSRRRGGLSLLLVALGIGAKESLALFPAFLWLFDRLSAAPSPTGLRGPDAGDAANANGRLNRSRSALNRYLPYALLSAAYVALRLTALNFHNTLNFYGEDNLLTQHYLYRALTYLSTLPKGLALWICPFDLHHERSWAVHTSWMHPQVLGGLALVAAGGMLAWTLRNRRPAVSVGVCWFFLATLPTSNLVVLINALFYDHWFLLPGVGLMFMLAAWLDRALNHATWRRTALLLSVVLLPLLAGATILLNGAWRDPISLYTHILSYEPRSAKIHNNLGMALADAGALDRAVEHYQQAIALSDEYPQTRHNLGNALLELGRSGEALVQFQRAVELSPGFHHSWIRLGELEQRRGRLSDAADAFTRAMEAHPYAASAYLGLAQIALQQQDRERALSILRQGVERMPDHPVLRNALQQLETLTAETAPESAPTNSSTDVRQ